MPVEAETVELNSREPVVVHPPCLYKSSGGLGQDKGQTDTTAEDGSAQGHPSVPYSFQRGVAVAGWHTKA